jgi:lambda family phage portal protein
MAKPSFVQRIRSAWATFRGRVAQRMYAGARASRLTTGLSSSSTSADSELVTSLTALRARSRQLCRDVSYAKRAKVLVVNNVIGSGIGMQAQVYNTRGELNTRVNDDIETVWCEWSKADSCHTGGRLSFAAFERACIAQIVEAGECFVRLHYQPFGDSKIPFALELIEAERVADQYSTGYLAAQSGNEIRMGVEVDSYFRPVAYFFTERHPSEFQFGLNHADKVERVPADQIIHLATGERWPQTRGEPWFAPVIKTFADVSGYVEAEITRARIQASPPWVIQTPEPSTSFGEEQDDGSVEMTVEPGVAKRLNPGEVMNAPPVNSPNPQVEPFMRYLLQNISAGLGVSYASLSADYSQSNYSSSRLALLDDRDIWRVFQSWFIDAFRVPVHRKWMQQAVLARAFSTFGVEQWALDREKFESVRFRPRGWGWVDPTKEVEAFKEAVRSGFMTMQDVVSTSGADIEELFDQRKKEVEMAEEAGLVFDTDPAQDKAKEAAQEPPPEPEAEPEEPEATEDEPAERRVFRFQR